ncbi:MAG: hypothetical protein SVX43_08315 [Cyanobacteriota bacterium]|nr:hypothetical protein [Cyanobacteriota bacterium]
MRVFILLLLVVGLILLATQNGSLQTLVVFGSQTVALPLAVWMAIAIAAGLLTSILLQLLYSRPGLAQAPVRESQELPRRDRPPFPEDRRRTPEGDRIADRERSTSDWETPASPNSDWESAVPPSQPKRQPPPRPDFLKKNDRPSQANSASRPSNSRENSPQSDRVYDAPYRVVNPPVPEPPEASEEEKTWVDGDDYESELRKQYRDRS